MEIFIRMQKKYALLVDKSNFFVDFSCSFYIFPLLLAQFQKETLSK